MTIKEYETKNCAICKFEETCEMANIPKCMIRAGIDNVTMEIYRNNVGIPLFDDEIRAIYEFVRTKNLMEDAKCQVEEYLRIEGVVLERELDDKDYSWLANRFFNTHDCNISDNDLWQEIVRNYITSIYSKQTEKRRKDGVC